MKTFSLFGHILGFQVALAHDGVWVFDGLKERYVDFFAFGCCERAKPHDNTHVVRLVLGPVLVLFGVL